MLDEVHVRHPGLLTGAAFSGNSNYCTGDSVAAVEEGRLEPYISVHSDPKRGQTPRYRPAARDGCQARERERKRRAADAANRLLSTHVRKYDDVCS